MFRFGSARKAPPVGVGIVEKDAAGNFIRKCPPPQVTNYYCKNLSLMGSEI